MPSWSAEPPARDRAARTAARPLRCVARSSLFRPKLMGVIDLVRGGVLPRADLLPTGDEAGPLSGVAGALPWRPRPVAAWQGGTVSRIGDGADSLPIFRRVAMYYYG